MTKEIRAVWTHNETDILIRNDWGRYVIPGYQFTVDGLRQLIKACEEAIEEETLRPPEPQPVPPF